MYHGQNLPECCACRCENIASKTRNLWTFFPRASRFWQRFSKEKIQIKLLPSVNCVRFVYNDEGQRVAERQYSFNKVVKCSQVHSQAHPARITLSLLWNGVCIFLLRCDWHLMTGCVRINPMGISCCWKRRKLWTNLIYACWTVVPFSISPHSPSPFIDLSFEHWPSLASAKDTTVLQSRNAQSCTTLFGHSIVLSLPAVLLRKVPNDINQLNHIDFGFMSCSFQDPKQWCWGTRLIIPNEQKQGWSSSGRHMYYFSKIQLVVYHQCCILIGSATSRLYVIISPLVAKSARHICNVVAVKKDWSLAITCKRCLVLIFFRPTRWILLKQSFLSPSWPLSR